jgi:hypothetical protein
MKMNEDDEDILSRVRDWQEENAPLPLGAFMSEIGDEIEHLREENQSLFGLLTHAIYCPVEPCHICERIEAEVCNGR